MHAYKSIQLFSHGKMASSMPGWRARACVFDINNNNNLKAYKAQISL